jgi:hypothetical protein
VSGPSVSRRGRIAIQPDFRCGQVFHGGEVAIHPGPRPRVQSLLAAWPSSKIRPTAVGRAPTTPTSAKAGHWPGKSVNQPFDLSPRDRTSATSAAQTAADGTRKIGRVAKFTSWLCATAASRRCCVSSLRYGPLSSETLGQSFSFRNVTMASERIRRARRSPLTVGGGRYRRLGGSSRSDRLRKRSPRLSAAHVARVALSTNCPRIVQFPTTRTRSASGLMTRKHSAMSPWRSAT